MDIATKTKKTAKATKEVKQATSKITIKQVASGAGRLKNQILTLKGLGLNKINRVVELNDTPEVRGMINKVKHLVKTIN